MDLVLKRKQYRNDGIFGELLDPAGRIVAFTLEHAYFDGQSYVPKIPIGKWQCKLGEHRLAHMTEPFSTFEVTGVEGHTDLLFHSGNRNADSAGCILLGSTIAGGRFNGEQFITASRAAFAKFMELQAGISIFELEVIDASR